MGKLAISIFYSENERILRDEGDYVFIKSYDRLIGRYNSTTAFIACL